MDFSNVDYRFRHTIQANCEGLAAVVVDASARHDTPAEVKTRLLTHIETLADAMADAFPQPKPQEVTGVRPTGGG